jgi:DnaJ-domain-containing protein 1
VRPSSRRPNQPVADEPLHRGEFVRLVYRLGRARATGILNIVCAPTIERVLIREGQLLTEPHQSIGPQAERSLARLAALRGATYGFRGGTADFPHVALRRQFAISGWARQHLEGQMNGDRGRALVAELAGVRLSIKPGLIPDRAICDKTDMRIIAAMSKPLRLDQIWPLARTPRFRLLTFLHFLLEIDALLMVGVAIPAPRTDLARAHRLLGVGHTANRVTVKRAYRRLARALHPDLHPGASNERRRHLEHKLAEVTSAYQELSSALDSGPSW